jgi:hypothetical protein
MEIKKYILPLIFVSFFIQSCGEKMQEEYPKDMVVTYVENGGMAPYGKNVFLSIDSSYVEFYNDGAKNKVYMKFSETDLKSLYEQFRKNNFSQIETYTEEGIMDRGGTTVTIEYGDKEIKKSNSGISFVEDSYMKYYTGIVDAINRLVDDFLNKMKRNFKIELDTSLIGENRKFQLDINRDDYSYNSEKEGKRDSIVIGVLDGENNFALSVGETRPGDLSSKRVPIMIDPMMSGIRFYYDSADIKWEKIEMNFN